MNAERRKAINAIKETLEGAKSELETLAQEERDAFDNMPEGMQQGDKGQKMEAAAEALDEAVSNVDDVLAQLETAVE